MRFLTLFPILNFRFETSARRRSRKRACRRPLSHESLEARSVLTFLAPASYDVGAAPQAIVSGDFDNDGRLDLGVANSDSTVSILRGDADGRFLPALGSPAVASIADLATGDFNADGKLDLVARSFGNSVSVLLGRGDGSFQAPSTVFNTEEELTSVSVGDFNADGLLELGIISNSWSGGYDPEYGYSWGEYSGWLTVLAGSGSGTFSAWRGFSLGFDYFGAGTLADFNGDGYQDFAAAGDWNTSLLWGNGAGYSDVPSYFDSLGSSSSGPLLARDLNGDGKLDLARAFGRGNSVSALWGNGGGQFSALQLISTGAQPNYLATGDINNDGHIDLITSNSEAAVNVLLGLGQGQFTAPITYGVGNQPRAVVVGDFGGDGLLDIASVNAQSNSVSVLINDGVWPAQDAPTITSDAVTVTEGNTGIVNAQFDVRLSAASAVPITVQYATADGAAMAGSDYQSTSGTLTFAPGETVKTVTVVVLGDRLAELEETFRLDLRNSTNAFVAGAGLGVIIDDEPRAALDPGPVNILEGNTTAKNATFTVRLSKAYDVPVSVNYSTADGDAQWWVWTDADPPAASAGSDYQFASGSLTFAAGETVKTISVAITGDRAAESDECFAVNLAGSSMVAVDEGSGHAAAIIVDDEPRVVIHDAETTEGNSGAKTVNFVVALAAAYDQPFTVHYATADGAATGGADYQTKSGSVTFAAGETTKNIAVQVYGDRLAEPDEYFSVNLVDAPGGVILHGGAYATIYDDEPRVTISDVSRSEGRRGQTTLFTFTVSLSAAYDQPVTMSFKTVNGTAKTSNGDYVAKSGTLTFAPGETSKTITAEVKGDSKKEGHEMFYVDLFALSSNAQFDKHRGFGEILNDD